MTERARSMVRLRYAVTVEIDGKDKAAFDVSYASFPPIGDIPEALEREADVLTDSVKKNLKAFFGRSEE